MSSSKADAQTSKEERLLEGIAHAHSNHSYDARLSYRELREFLLARGLRFACMTEHIEELGQGDIDRIVDGCRETSDDEFLFVPGIEMDCFVVYFLGIDHVEVDFSSDRTVYESLRSVARLCVFAHPIKAKYRYPDWQVQHCDGVEVINTKHDGQHYLRPQSERLLESVRRIRPRALALGGMDFHGPREYSEVRLRLTRPGPLTESFVLDSLQQGMFEIVKAGEAFASYGVMRRNSARTRIRLMDLAHSVHRGLTKRGASLPSPLKRYLRRLFEGR